MKSEGKEYSIKYILIPLIFVLLLWLVKLLETALELELYVYGLYPRTVDGLIGVFLAPFIHGDYGHLIANSVPMLALGTGLFYFYSGKAFQVLLITWLFSALAVWLFGRESYHIGASGLIYGLAGFLFMSGVLSSDIRLLSISLVVVFMYGSIVWGVFPMEKGVSWESHLAGMISGLAMAIAYRKPKPPYDDDDDTGQEGDGHHTFHNQATRIYYHLRKDED